MPTLTPPYSPPGRHALPPSGQLLSLPAAPARLRPREEPHLHRAQRHRARRWARGGAASHGRQALRTARE
eukprot:scaffold20278_cov57-Phaeocystis_antarctica.AAC.2